MVKANFVGDGSHATYKTAVFDAVAGDDVFMPDSIWQEIVNKGDNNLFSGATTIEKEYPTVKTVG